MVALVLWLALGAIRWKGLPWEHPSGAAITLALAAIAMGVVATIGLLALRGPGWRDLLLATAGLTAVRLTVSSTFPILDDGVYYWLWSRNLGLAYADHPGMIAWLTRLIVPWDVHTAAAVRAAPIIVGAGLPLATFGLLRDMGGARPVAARAGLLVLLLPLQSWSLFLTPHPPLSLFSLLALWMGWRAFTRDCWRDWVAAGLAVGAALNCNFLSGVLGVSLLLYLLITDDRRHLARRRLWVAVGLVALAAVPLVVWNAQHDWITFRFNLSGRHSRLNFEAVWLLAFALQLALVTSPAVTIWGVLGVPSSVRRARQLNDRATLYLACAVVVPVVLLAFAMALIEPRTIYSGQAAVPLTILFVFATREKLGWYRAGVFGAAGLTVALFAFPPAFALASRESIVSVVPHKDRRSVAAHFGWPALANYLATQGRFGRETPQVLIAATYGAASQVPFFAESVDFAYCYNPTPSPYGRQFEEWAVLADLPLGQDALLLYIGEPWSQVALAQLGDAFREIERVELDEPALRPFQLYRARGWRGWPEPHDVPEKK